MGTSGALDGDRPIAEFTDWGKCVACCTSFEVLEVTPLSNTPRDLVVPILLGADQSLGILLGARNLPFVLSSRGYPSFA